MNSLKEILDYLEEAGQMIMHQPSKWRVERATKFVKSLRPVVPPYISDWFRMTEFPLEAYLNHRMGNDTLTKDVELFFGLIDDPIQELVNMIQFGYTVQEPKKYYIRAPHQLCDYGPRSLYLVKLANKSEGATCYALDADQNQADAFTLEEAKAIMAQLRVDWELEEVEG